MATISNTPRPGYVWDSTDNVWYPIGVGGHGHPDYITQATAVNPTIIDAKGDIITATAADTPARLAVGNNGETLVADSSTSSGLRYQGSLSAGRNYFINGGQDIWQRGTSIAVTTGTTVYTSDRFQIQANGANNAMTVSRQVTGDTTNLPNIQYCARVQRNSGQTGTTVSYFAQSIESANSIQFAGKTVTMSFYARAGANYSPSSSILTANLYSGTGTDQSVLSTYTGAAAVIGQNVTLTTTWQRFTMNGTVGATATELALYLNWTSVGTAGTNDYFEVTGLQLELGSVATTFSRAGGTIQGELAACQRYYEKSYDQATVPGTVNSEKGQIFAPSGNAGNGVQVCSIRYAVVKRNVPTITFYSYSGATAKLSDAGGTDLAANSAFTNNTAYGGNSGTRIYNGSGGTITAAYGGYEFHFVADSEL